MGFLDEVSMQLAKAFRAYRIHLSSTPRLLSRSWLARGLNPWCGGRGSLTKEMAGAVPAFFLVCGSVGLRTTEKGSPVTTDDNMLTLIQEFLALCSFASLKQAETAVYHVCGPGGL